MFNLLTIALAASAALAVPLELRSANSEVATCQRTVTVYVTVTSQNALVASSAAKSSAAVTSKASSVVTSSATPKASSVTPKASSAITSKASSMAATSAATSKSSSTTSKASSAIASSAKATSSAVATTSRAIPSSSSKAPVPVSSSTKATTTTSSAAAVSTTSDPDAALYLKLHNDFRAQYGANPLTWSSDLAAHAKTVSSTCKFAHSITSGEGQNLAAGVGGGYSITTAFNSWANEASLYDYNKPGFSEGAGHFTQVVWKGTTQVGCALVNCPNGSIFDAKYNSANIFVTCNYKAAGNIVGNNGQYFVQNVGKKV